MYILRISIAIGLVSIIAAGPFLGNPSVCSPFTPGRNDPPRPNMTYPQYSVRIEANIKNKHYTETYQEYYDSINNMAAFKATIGGNRRKFIYNFPTKELYVIDTDGNTCSVSNLTGSSASTLFGQTVPGQDSAKIYSVANALSFSNSLPAQWINVTNVRGVPCNLWRSCAYWPAQNTTMVMDWYFSVDGYLTTQALHQVPMRAHVKGAAINQASGLNHTFEHTYEFVDFTNSVDPSAFLTPESAYCPGRILTKNLPVPAKTFHFSAEILDLQNNLIGFIKEWYDQHNNLVRFDMTPMGPSPYGSNPLTQIHDFTTGVAYIIDDYLGNCSITNISSAGFDIKLINKQTVRLRTPQEFFYFDNTNYNYEGQKMARGILCDVFICQRNDWPYSSPGTSTWEWYFATKNYSADLPDIPKFGMPVMMEMKANLPPNNFQLHYVYNMYNYDEKQPVLWDYNIGQCFNDTGRQDYNFILPGSFRSTVASDMNAFKLAVLNALKGAGQILSPLRINNIQIDYADNNDIIVYFTLFDRPPNVGDVANPKQEPPMGTVANLLTNAINGGSLQITVNDVNGQPVTMTAKQNTFMPSQQIVQYTHYQQTQPGQVQSTGYSGGVMAGMGVALAVVFFVLGLVAVFLFKRNQAGPIPSVRFDNQKEKEDITQDFS